MANQDVQIREVDVIRTYNQKFGEFYVSFSSAKLKKSVRNHTVMVRM